MWRGCVLGTSRAGEHDTLIKERTYWPGPLRRRKIETLYAECQHRWEKWRQKRREGRKRERGAMEVDQTKTGRRVSGFAL